MRGEESPVQRPWLKGAARGVVGAMAMSGMRQLAVGVGAIQRTPPEAILKEGLPWVLARVPENRRTAAIELAHWGYGAAAGSLFALLPSSLRRRRITGPVYGVLSWAALEVVIAPAFGLAHARRSRPQDRIALFIDHVFFGFVVGAPPEAVVSGPEARLKEEPGEGPAEGKRIGA